MISLGLFILVLFVVDKVVLSPVPEHTISAATVIDHLNRHDVRRVTIPARTVTVELNDGKTLVADVTADRDLWPAIRRSGADVTILPGSARPSDTSLLNYVVEFAPFVVVALLLLYVLRSVGRTRSL